MNVKFEYKTLIWGGVSNLWRRNPEIHTERRQAQVGLSPRLPKGGLRRRGLSSRLIESEVSYG